MPAKTASFALLLLAATQLGGTSAQNLRGDLKIVEEAPLKSTRNISDKSATVGLPRTEIELGPSTTRTSGSRGTGTAPTS